MEIKIFVNNAFQENTILLYDETHEAAIIDCGCSNEKEREKFARFVTDNHLRPVVLLNTHLHIDHILGNHFVHEKYGLLPQAHEADDFWIGEALVNAQMMGFGVIDQPPATGKHLKEGDVVKFGANTLSVLETPGHTPGGICFYNATYGLLISGDTLFARSVGRTDLEGGNARQLVESIRTKILTLDDDVRIVPGHGPKTTVELEKKHNLFLK